MCDFTLYVPKHIGTIHCRHSPKKRGEKVLVLREPLAWLLGYYLKEEVVLTFKEWFKYFAPEPQSTLCSPDKIVRSEYFQRDMKEEVGVHATISLSILANAEVCSATRANILKRYKEDYRMGDYLGEW